MATCLGFSTYLFSQPMALVNAYAHNDYWNKRPLLDALSNGFTHIEADVYLRRGRLIVSHNLPIFSPKSTLEKLYLIPLFEYLTLRQQHQQTALDTLVLMIDIKSDGEKTYEELKKILQPYQSILSTCENGKQIQRNLTIVITGHKPILKINSEKNRNVFIDENLKKVASHDYQSLYPIASCRYSSLLKWKGKGKIPANEKLELCELVATAHANGKKVRFWASPENERVWQELLICGVDLINTNKIAALKQFFASFLTDTSANF